MFLLPIVDRELRVTARRDRTYWVRLAAAVAAFGISLWICLGPNKLLPPGQLGRTLFSALTVLAFGYCLLVCPFITADCISEEKRDGTLGLLYLTDLSSYDVVLGKWAAASLTGLYCLLAMLPSLALPLLLGGVTAGECLRAALGVLNAIFFSLAAGMFVSTVSRDQTKAILGSAVLILAVAGLVPGLATVAATDFFTRPVSEFPAVALASPFYAGYLARDAVYSVGRGGYDYWLSLGIVHGMSWLFMGATLVLAPRVWRDSSHEKPSSHRWLWRLGYTSGWRRAFKRRLEINPVFALAARLRWPYFVFWGLVTLVALNVLWLTLGARWNQREREFHGYFSNALVLTNRVWITAMACRFFLELRRTGGLELILTTPVTVSTLLRGHWRALRRLFFWPVLAISVLHVFFAWSSWQGARSGFPGGHTSITLYAMAAGQSLVQFLTDILALCWVGAWLSVSSRKPGLAILQTYCVVILLPWAFAYFASPASRGMLSSTWWVAKNGLLILWASLRVRRHFREAAAQTYVRWRWRPRWSRRSGCKLASTAPPANSRSEESSTHATRLTELNPSGSKTS